MKILITCGPSYEPIDQARRLTNFSTGRLGVTLANHFTGLGHDVLCLKGEGATFLGAVAARRVGTFATNDDPAATLQRYGNSEPFDVVLHAAALCDYRVAEVLNGAGESIRSAKFATRDGRLTMVMAPALKVLPLMRGWFPGARIVGWKYELAGTSQDAFDKAWRQLRDNDTDACVLNGAAYGDGFALCFVTGSIRTCTDTMSLARALEEWFRFVSPECPANGPAILAKKNV
ncbi:MAG TPA: phosphopantothenoylcysteine decarboxylase [Roseimicrobium sp.]|nr:phosphopantothenoylcysteine decarboxylase [Roseimicrobium sp.]